MSAISKKLEEAHRHLHELEQFLQSSWDMVVKEQQRLKDEEGHLKLEREKLDQRAKQFLNDQRKFEIEKEFAKDITTATLDRVLIDVGGKVIETSRSTMTRMKDSLLAVIFGGQQRVTRTPEGHYFLDRDHKFFRYVLNFLRTKKLQLPSPTDQPLYSCIVEEFHHFSIPISEPLPALLRSTFGVSHTLSHKCFGVNIFNPSTVVSVGLSEIKFWKIKTGALERCVKIKPEVTHASDNAISKEGKNIVWGGRDNEGRGCIWKYNVETEEIKIIPAHSDSVSCIKLQDGLIVTGSKDKTIKVWNLNTCTCIRTYLGHDANVCSLDVNPSKDLLASGSYDETIKLWSISKGYCLKTFTGHKESVRSIKICHHSNNVISNSNSSSNAHGLLISGSFDRTIKIWDIDRGHCLRTLMGHTDWVSCIGLIDAAVIVSAGWDKVIKIWGLDGKCHKTIDEVGPVSCLDADNDLIVCAVDKTIKIWEVIGCEG